MRHSKAFSFLNFRKRVQRKVNAILDSWMDGGEGSVDGK